MKKALSLSLALLIVISALTGCTDDVNNLDHSDIAGSITSDITGDITSDNIGGNTTTARIVTAHELAASALGKDYDESNYIYDKPLHDVYPTQPLEWEISYDPADIGIGARDLRRIINVYSDSDLTVSARPEVEYDAEKGLLVVTPQYIPDLKPSNYLYNSWGSGSQYFAVRYYSAEGEKLKKPIVTVFTVKNDLEAPYVNFTVKDGYASFSWEAVPGADSYEFYVADVFDSEYSGKYYMTGFLFETTETSYLYDEKYMLSENHVFQNPSFKIHEAGVVTEYFISAVAKSGDRISQFGNAIHSSEVASLLPYCVPISINSDDEETKSHARDINLLGVYRWIEMCDNSLLRMPVAYHIEEAEVTDASWLLPNNFKPGELLGMYIPYTVLNTGIEGYSFVRNYDYPEFEADLQRLKDREIDEHKAGSDAPKIMRSTGDDIVPDVQQDLTVGEFHVNASNALVEYLAVHMLNGAEYIDVREFNEAFNAEYLIAAWQEAYYQNPMIIKVESLSWSFMGGVFITYSQTRDEQARKQAELQAEVKRVVSAVITDGMTDLEKQLALNSYLIETAEYDFACLEAAAQSNYEYVDPSFDDSFTAYGVLINKVGVCASYAAAFKLLADEAGLPSVVVTGYMYGTLPHAWNRVLIGNEWLTMDTTNNDNVDSFYNIYFNLPDFVVETIFVEDASYSMSRDAYRSSSSQWEYYRIEGLFYDEGEIAAELVRELNEKGYAMLRTSYDLTEARFMAIVNDIISIGGFHNLEGGAILGAIYLLLA